MGWDQMPIHSFAFTPQKAHCCSQRKGVSHGADLFAKSKGQTQNFIFEPQIYSFLFRHFEKRFRKSRKSLENSAFCVVSCKTVISDKW